MKCIACHNETKLIKSHVISNFVRKKLTGEVINKNTAYRFNWLNRPDLPQQDLPKPLLMCAECDSAFGESIERDAATVLIPETKNGDENYWKVWELLNIHSEKMEDVLNDSFYLGVYKYPDQTLSLLREFATLTAWRALHAIARDDEQSKSREFIESQNGVEFDNLVIKYLTSSKESKEEAAKQVSTASLYYWGPNNAILLTSKNDELPFAFAELSDCDGVLLGIGVVFAFWIVLWPVFADADTDSPQKMTKLHQQCFERWFAQMYGQFRVQLKN